MARCVMAVGFVIGLLTAATAQQGGSGAAEASAPAEESAAVEKAPRVSEAGRAALAAGRALVAGLRGVHGAERKVALERAAAAHDRIAEQFAGEPAVAAAVSFAAAGLWRQHGSLDRAEKDYLRAVAVGGERFAQRGLLGAADMQRRLGRPEEALRTYAQVEAADPHHARAQQARLWRARVLDGTGRFDEALAAFRAALEYADTPSQAIEACNLLALAWVGRGDLDAAAKVIAQAEQAVEAAADDDPQEAERHRAALEAMSARKALQRARDAQNGARADAAALDEARRDAKDD